MRIKAAVSYEDEPTPRIEQVDLADPRADELLVRIVATGICHTDLHCHGPFGSMFAAKPIVLGHEGAGVVEAVGAGVEGFDVGDHVVLSGNSCGQCPSCLSGRPVYCDSQLRLCWGGCRADGTSPISREGERISGSFFGQSSFATHVVASERTAVKVPVDVPLHLMGPLACGMMTGAGSVLEALKLRPGQSIAVFGSGAVGLAAVMAARIAGASQIVAIDIDPDRLSLACELGATAALPSDEQTVEGLQRLNPRGFDFSYVTAQPPQVFDAAVACLATGGTAGLAIFPSDASWAPDVRHLMTGGRKLQGIIGGDANPKTFIPQLVEFWRRGQFPFDRMITQFRFDQFADVWTQYQQGRIIKPVLRMDGMAGDHS